MKILYEDNHLFVVVKPPGLLTQPSGTSQDSLEAQAKAFLKTRDHKPGNVFLEAVHRLDKPVGGIVVFAKTSKAVSRLNAAQREKKFRKVYHAHVEGKLAQKSGTLTHHLHHDHHLAKVDPEGKKAVLHYRVLEEGELSSLVEVELETGRYHQIRVQFAHIGHPILGDHKYGSKAEWKDGIALTHVQIEFPHPITSEVLKISLTI